MINQIKRMDNSCHIPDLVQAFSNVENGGLNRVYSGFIFQNNIISRCKAKKWFKFCQEFLSNIRSSTFMLTSSVNPRARGSELTFYCVLIKNMQIEHHTILN